MSRLAGLHYTAFFNLRRRRIIIDRLDSTTIETRRQGLWASSTAFMVVVAMASNLVGCILLIKPTKLTFL